MNKCLYCNALTLRKNYCSSRCGTYDWKKKVTKKRKEEHRCIDCGVKLKPVTIYYRRCPKHLKSNKQ